MFQLFRRKKAHSHVQLVSESFSHKLCSNYKKNFSDHANRILKIKFFLLERPQISDKISFLPLLIFLRPIQHIRSEFFTFLMTGDYMQIVSPPFHPEIAFP